MAARVSGVTAAIRSSTAASRTSAPSSRKRSKLITQPSSAGLPSKTTTRVTRGISSRTWRSFSSWPASWAKTSTASEWSTM